MSLEKLAEQQACRDQRMVFAKSPPHAQPTLGLRLRSSKRFSAGKAARWRRSIPAPLIGSG